MCVCSCSGTDSSDRSIHRQMSAVSQYPPVPRSRSSFTIPARLFIAAIMRGVKPGRRVIEELRSSTRTQIEARSSKHDSLFISVSDTDTLTVESPGLLKVGPVLVPTPPPCRGIRCLRLLQRVAGGARCPRRRPGRHRRPQRTSPCIYRQAESGLGRPRGRGMRGRERVRVRRNDVGFQLRAYITQRLSAYYPSKCWVSGAWHISYFLGLDCVLKIPGTCLRRTGVAPARWQAPRRGRRPGNPLPLRRASGRR